MANPNNRADRAQSGGFGGEESAISRSEAPSAFMMAKSRRRSKTHPINVDSTQSAAVRIIRMAAPEGGARLSQDLGFAFHDLADGADVGCREEPVRAVE